MSTLGEIVVNFTANISSIMEAVASINEQFASLTGVADEAGAGVAEGLMQATEGMQEVVASVDEVDTALSDIASVADEAGAGVAEGMSEAVDELNSVADAAANASEAVSETGTAAQSASGSGGSGGGIGSFLGGLGKIASKAGMAYIGLQGFGQMVVGTAGKLIGTAAQAEQTGVAFDTLMKSTSKAQAMLAKLNTFAATTPFQTQAIDDGASKLLAFGINAQDVIPDISCIGDSLSALGKATPAALSSIIDVFGKIQAAGKLTGGDMMQLSRWGIPAWQMLSETMGKPVDVLQKMVSKGLVPSSMALADLQAGMEKTFGGGMAKQAQTFTGLMSTFQSNVVLAWNSFLGVSGGQVTKGSLFDMVEKGLSGVGNILANPAFQQFAVVMGTDIGQSIQKVGTFLSTTLLPPFEQLDKALTPIVTPIIQWGEQNDVLQKSLQGVVTVAGGLVVGVGTLAGGLASVISWFDKGGPAVQITEDALLGVGVAMAAIKIGQFVSTIPALLESLGAWATGQWTVAAATIATALPYIAIGLVIALVVAGVILAIQHWGQIAHWLQGAWKATQVWFGSFWKEVTVLFNDAINGIHTIFDAVGTWLYDTFVQPFVSAWDTISGIFNNISGVVGKLTGAMGNVGGVLSHIPGFASGVNNFSGGWAIVGESGPELVNLPGGSSVYPHGTGPGSALQGGAMPGGAGGTTHVTVQLDSSVLAEYMGPAMQQHIILHAGGLLP